jgi:hypothetical protein
MNRDASEPESPVAFSASRVPTCVEKSVASKREQRDEMMRVNMTTKTNAVISDFLPQELVVFLPHGIKEQACSSHTNS